LAEKLGYIPSTIYFSRYRWCTTGQPLLMHSSPEGVYVHWGYLTRCPLAELRPISTIHPCRTLLRRVLETRVRPYTAPGDNVMQMQFNEMKKKMGLWNQRVFVQIQQFGAYNYLKLMNWWTILYIFTSLISVIIN
jgi:hypothetical protein